MGYKYDINAIYDKYLQASRLNIDKMDQKQLIEMKRAFMGGLVEMLATFKDSVIAQESGLMFNELSDQLRAFWITQLNNPQFN